MVAHLGGDLISRSEAKNWLARAYMNAKSVVLSAGFGDEITWQEQVNLDSLTEQDLLRESAWVILSAGMSESIVRRRFPKISESFFWWESARNISRFSEACCRLAVQHFNHPRKISAIAEVARRIAAEGFEAIHKEILANPLVALQQFPFVGPVTVYHLAKNIGAPVAKPDRHLKRFAISFGYNDVQEFCRSISEQVGDSVQVVDIVLWRYATLTRNQPSVSTSSFPNRFRRTPSAITTQGNGRLT